MYVEPYLLLHNQGKSFHFFDYLVLLIIYPIIWRLFYLEKIPTGQREKQFFTSTVSQFPNNSVHFLHWIKDISKCCTFIRCYVTVRLDANCIVTTSSTKYWVYLLLGNKLSAGFSFIEFHLFEARECKTNLIPDKSFSLNTGSS